MAITPTHNTINVALLSMGFFFIFLAFFSQGLIEETVINTYAQQANINKHAGYISLAIIYAVFTVANFFAPPIVATITARWAMVIGGLAYAVFQAGFLFLNESFLYGSSALVGIAAAIIWCAQGKYLTINSSAATAGKHSGIFFTIFQSCLIFGGIFLFLIFQYSENKIELSTIRIIYGAFTGVTICGIVIFAILPMPGSKYNLYAADFGNINDANLSQIEIIKSTFALVTTKRMLIISVAFMYSGIVLSFWSGIYPTCIAFTKKLGENVNIPSLLAMNVFFEGLGQAIGGFICGTVSSKFKLRREFLVLAGTLIQLSVFITIFLYFPKEASLDKTDNIGILEPNIYIALTCGFLIGLGDIYWRTQLYAFVIEKYSTKPAEAFSIFMFFQSLLSCAAFFYGTTLNLHWHLSILTIGVILAFFCFLIAERVQERELVSTKEIDVIET